MATTQTDQNVVYDTAGNILSSETVQTDVTLPTENAALVNFSNQLSTYISQSQSDANAWPTADQTTRDQIMERVLNGFANLCTALQDLSTHLNLNG